MKTKTFSNINFAAWLLRLGLSVIFLYAGTSALLHSEQWLGYLPSFLQKLSDATTLLRIFALYEIILALWLLSGFYVRYAALLAAATLLGIVVTQPHALIITFRDVGLVFMALALAAQKNNS